MKKFIFGAVVIVSLVVGLLVWFVGLPEHPYQLVSPEYNFSALFPDTPAVTHSLRNL